MRCWKHCRLADKFALTCGAAGPANTSESNLNVVCRFQTDCTCDFHQYLGNRAEACSCGNVDRASTKWQIRSAKVAPGREAHLSTKSMTSAAREQAMLTLDAVQGRWQGQRCSHTSQTCLETCWTWASPPHLHLSHPPPHSPLPAHQHPPPTATCRSSWAAWTSTRAPLHPLLLRPSKVSSSQSLLFILHEA